MSLLPQSIADAVQRDHLPRQATADDHAIHVLYWEAPNVRSMDAADWLAQHGALPVDPTQAESDAAVAALVQSAQQAQTDAATLRQQVIAIAQSTVGLPINTAFTNAQLRALLIVLLHKAGAINPADMTIRPLADWLR